MHRSGSMLYVFKLSDLKINTYFITCTNFYSIHICCYAADSFLFTFHVLCAFLLINSVSFMSVLFWLQVCTPFAFIYTFCFHIQLARKEICFHIHFAERKELFNPTAVCLQQTACSFDKSIFETFFETFFPPFEFA